tara:strand:- start:774 stop:1277 length:504 start_codon:yes stop_codon:yes gene_type:complete
METITVTEPAKNPFSNVIFDEDPEHTEAEWRELGKDSKTEYEEMRHAVYQIPKEPIEGTQALKFRQFKRGRARGDWAWDRDNIVVHLNWSPPPRAHKHNICVALAKALHGSIASDMQVTLKATLATQENGGPYTIIFHMIALKPSAESWFERKILPAITAVDPYRLR